MDSQVTVKAVILNPDNKALIMNEKGRWQAPGGRTESGERLREGLVREVYEETGIEDLEIGAAIHVDEWFATPEDKHVHIVAIFYECRTKTTDIKLEPIEHEDFAWVGLDDLPNYVIEPEMKKAIEIVLGK
ncbi:MAG TPA: NUDIX hydrolase [Candidatus Limnocylindrales bacterium]|nr:NUDIX hydrolase [Candidatus Limnocylindrales bacterium]